MPGEACHRMHWPSGILEGSGAPVAPATPPHSVNPFRDDVHGKVAGLHYTLRKPSKYLGQWFAPLVLFLHGAGERGDANGTNIMKVYKHGPWKSPGNESCLILAPQCPTGQLWPALAKELVVLVEQVAETYRVDRSRIYGTGLSLGAFGIWAVASLRPLLFAAVVPICGGFTLPVLSNDNMHALLRRAKLPVKKSELDPLGHLPVWLFHGAMDKRVDVAGSLNVWNVLGGRSTR